MEKKKFKKPKYVTHLIIASWDKKIKDFKVLLLKTQDGRYKLPRRKIDFSQNETALDTAKKEVEDTLGLEAQMFRHIAVFDDPKRDEKKYTISNVIFVIVDEIDKKDVQNQNVKVINLEEINEFKIKDDNKDMIQKFEKMIDYDIYSQIFDTHKFGSDFIVALLGQEFTTSQLIDLAKWAGREENRTTFYRNINNNYDFVKKVGRNKYYKKANK